MSDLSICNGVLHMHKLHLYIEELREMRSSTKVWRKKNNTAKKKKEVEAGFFSSK